MGVDPAAVARYQQYLAQQQAARAQAEQQRLAAIRQQQEAQRQAAVEAEAERRKGIAVVELFTSQGCSSCPPADSALKQIAKVAQDRGLKVYPLSFHIDYWDKLGWKDPYSQPDFTTRQTAYSTKQPGNRIYTPQMIVNGTTEFLGSDRDAAHKNISAALRSRPRTQVDVRLTKAHKDAIEVEYQLNGFTSEIALNLAVTQSPPKNHVPRGENAGRDSMHINVVRALRVLVPEDSSGTAILELPEDFDPSIPSTLVGYTQDKSSFAITGAKALELDLSMKKPPAFSITDPVKSKSSSQKS